MPAHATRTLLVTAVALAAFLAPAHAADGGPSAFEREILRLTNQARASGVVCGGIRRPPAPPLVWHDGLARSARRWSRHLAATGRLSHDRLRQRIKALGLKVCRGKYGWGENVAYNASPERVVRAWLRSASHCRNIMNPRYRLIGVGMVQHGRRQYYTQLFHSSTRC